MVPPVRKTHCVAVLLLWSCLRNRGFNVLVLAPAVRESKIIIRKITNFLPRPPKRVYWFSVVLLRINRMIFLRQNDEEY
jgi:hypothetical protein